MEEERGGYYEYGQVRLILLCEGGCIAKLRKIT